MDSHTFKLTPGTWHSYFRDANTLTTLTPVAVLMCFIEMDWVIPIPENLRGDKDVELVVKRIA